MDNSISVEVTDAAGKLLMECVIETKAATILEFHPGTAWQLMGNVRGRDECSLAEVTGPCITSGSVLESDK